MSVADSAIGLAITVTIVVSVDVSVIEPLTDILTGIVWSTGTSILASTGTFGFNGHVLTGSPLLSDCGGE